jgi:hypothetical protein
MLSPYAHELNGQGTKCADDCPACRWAAKKSGDCVTPGCGNRGEIICGRIAGLCSECMKPGPNSQVRAQSEGAEGEQNGSN